MQVTLGRAETPEDIDAVRDPVRGFFHWAMAEVAKTDALIAKLARENWMTCLERCLT